MPSPALEQSGSIPPPPRIHFISGLPRSGSTLLSALLRQNPRFYANMTGPVAGIFDALLSNMSRNNEFSIFISDAQRQRILHGVFAGYYSDNANKIVFDTSRSWCGRLAALKTLFPDVRIIVCVRDLAWIIDSFERLIRGNAFQPSAIFNFKANGTVYTRANGLAATDGMVGAAYDLVKEAFYGDDAQHLLLVQYETLTTNPAQAIAAIYDFIGEPEFAHDFDHIEFDATAFDAQSGTPGLHRVGAKIEPASRQTILPPDLFRRFENQAFWRQPDLNLRGVKIV